MQEFLIATRGVEMLLERLHRFLAAEILRSYPNLLVLDESSLPQVMDSVFAQTGCQFVIVIDEWDCVMREHQADEEGQRLYLDFLRAWLKDKPYVALCYMTGILPIKKYGSHSALNMFDEFSMVEPGRMAPYMGFTEGEVDELCAEWGRDLDEYRAWYDGYLLEGAGSVYAPRSVVRAMEDAKFGSWWTQTETFEALRKYIDMDFDDLHERVVELMGGGRVNVGTGTYANDMTTFHSADDVLTLLVHLGCLGYDARSGEAFVPNREVMGEWANSTADPGWTEVARSIKDSERLLGALLAGRADEVAAGVAQAYEDEGNVVLCGIAYDPKTKTHSCAIERGKPS